jgi:hypothetical protein
MFVLRLLNRIPEAQWGSRRPRRARPPQWVKEDEQGAELVRLLRSFPAVYAAQDYAAKAKLRKALVSQITLRDGEAEVEWVPPFEVPAQAGQLLYNEQKWGE